MGILQFRRYGFGLEITSDVSKKQARCVACNTFIPKQTRRVVMRTPQVQFLKHIKGVPYIFRPKLFFHEGCYLSPVVDRTCHDCHCGLPEYTTAILCMPCQLSDRYCYCIGCHETIRRRDSRAVRGERWCKKCLHPNLVAELEYQARYDEIMKDLVLKDEFL